MVSRKHESVQLMANEVSVKSILIRIVFGILEKALPKLQLKVLLIKEYLTQKFGQKIGQGLLIHLISIHKFHERKLKI